MRMRSERAPGYRGYISDHQSHDFLSLAIARRLIQITPDPALTRQAPKDDLELALPQVQDLAQLGEVQNAVIADEGPEDAVLRGLGVLLHRC